MFMGRRDGINFFKHGISRRYLLMDDFCRTYEQRSRGQFVEIPFEEALAQVEDPLKSIGEGILTQYDDAYIRRRERALRAAGFETIRIIVEPDEGEV
jgi:hypothetical protein